MQRNVPELQWVSVDRLKPSQVTLRHHPSHKLRKLKSSISRFGVIVPLLIDGDDRVVDGHARLKAAVDLGLTYIPALSVAMWSEEEIRILRLAVNRLAQEAIWDQQALGEEFEALIAIETDLELTGFDTIEIETAIQIGPDPAGETESLDSELAPEGGAVAAHGDIWMLQGSITLHHIACGDCRDEALSEKLFGKLKANACFGDAPYNVPVAGHVSGLGKVRHAEFAMASGEMSPTEYIAFLTGMLKAVSIRLEPGAVCYQCMDWRGICTLFAAAEQADFEPLNLAVWVKTNPSMGSLYRSQHELVAVFKKRGGQHSNNVQLGRYGRSRSNVWNYRGVNVFGPERAWLAKHPTPKPSALVADAIRDVTRPGNIIFDPFLGSGTTLIAAERTRRRCFGIEIEPRFVDLAIRRWQAETGKSAVRQHDGRSFDDVAAAQSINANAGQ